MQLSPGELDGKVSLVLQRRNQHVINQIVYISNGLAFLPGDRALEAIPSPLLLVASK